MGSDDCPDFMHRFARLVVLHLHNQVRNGSIWGRLRHGSDRSYLAHHCNPAFHESPKNQEGLVPAHHRFFFGVGRVLLSLSTCNNHDLCRMVGI